MTAQTESYSDSTRFDLAIMARVVEYYGTIKEIIDNYR